MIKDLEYILKKLYLKNFIKKRIKRDIQKGYEKELEIIVDSQTNQKTL